MLKSFLLQNCWRGSSRICSKISSSLSVSQEGSGWGWGWGLGEGAAGKRGPWEEDRAVTFALKGKQPYSPPSASSKRKDQRGGPKLYGMSRASQRKNEGTHKQAARCLGLHKGKEASPPLPQ